MIDFNFGNYGDIYITYGSEIVNQWNYIFLQNPRTNYLRKEKINDLLYKIGTVIVIEICDDEPVFGRIEKINVINKKIRFECTIIISFNRNYFANSGFIDCENKTTLDYTLFEWAIIILSTCCGCWNNLSHTHK